MTAETQRLKALIDLVAEENIAELQLVEGGTEFHVVLREGVHGTPSSGATQVAASPIASPADAGATPRPATASSQRHTVSAPMPGTFYRAAGAGGNPLVELGVQVQPGTPLGIVEAMKMLNEITSDRAGKVVKILVEDGRPVEQGQALFEIEPGA